jgi:CheY-like chemotaxis protein
MGKHIIQAHGRHDNASRALPAHRIARDGAVPLPVQDSPFRAEAVHSHDLARRGGLLLLPFRKSQTAAIEPVMPAAQPPIASALALLDATKTQPSTAPRPAVGRRHILIVEDDAPTVGVLRHALELEGDPEWSVEVAGEGLRALELAAGTPPDVILLDVRLPGLDGGEVYRRLRASHPTGRTRVLFLTAGTSLDLYRMGIDDGVLLRKPFDVQQLVSLVRALLAV